MLIAAPRDFPTGALSGTAERDAVRLGPAVSERQCPLHGQEPDRLADE
jgi:hypothetical protein